jgi:hypothetical protein
MSAWYFENGYFQPPLNEFVKKINHLPLPSHSTMKKKIKKKIHPFPFLLPHVK